MQSQWGRHSRRLVWCSGDYYIPLERRVCRHSLHTSAEDEAEAGRRRQPVKDTRFHVERTEGPTPVEILPVVLLQYQKDVYLSFYTFAFS